MGLKMAARDGKSAGGTGTALSIFRPCIPEQFRVVFMLLKDKSPRPWPEQLGRGLPRVPSWCDTRYLPAIVHYITNVCKYPGYLVGTFIRRKKNPKTNGVHRTPLVRVGGVPVVRRTTLQEAQAKSVNGNWRSLREQSFPGNGVLVNAPPRATSRSRTHRV